jgi:hypothetical protein
MTKFLTALLIFTSITIGNTQEAKSPTSEAKNNWVTLDEKDFTIKYPEKWELNQSKQMGTAFILFSPIEGNQDKIRENVNLLVQDLSGYGLDLNQYAILSEEQVKTLITKSVIIESKRVKTSSNEYQRMIYTGDQGTLHLKFEQFYWVKNDRAYVLTFTCEQDKFATFKEVGEAILKSFKLKE